MTRIEFEAAILQSLLQEQVDRQLEYRRLDVEADQRILAIDARLAAIDKRLDRLRGIVG